MTDDFTELDRLRARRADRRGASRRPALADPPVFIGQVVSSSAGITAGHFCEVNPTTVLGAEVEGQAGSFAGAAATVPVYLVRGQAAAGAYCICRFVEHRWVTELKGVVFYETTGGTSRCYEPEQTDPNPTYTTQAHGPLTIVRPDGSTFSTNSFSFPVTQDGTYRVTMTLPYPDSRSQTQSATLFASRQNPPLVFTFDRHSTNGCKCFCDGPKLVHVSAIYNPPPYSGCPGAATDFGPAYSAYDMTFCAKQSEVPAYAQPVLFDGTTDAAAAIWIGPLMTDSRGLQCFPGMTCNTNNYGIVLYYLADPRSTGNQSVWSWAIENRQNTCSPFLLHDNYPRSSQDPGGNFAACGGTMAVSG